MEKKAAAAAAAAEDEKKGKLEGLPVDTSPYTQYKDLEDYKKQGYGTEGHLEPNPARGAAAATDAPTTTDDPKVDQLSSSSTAVINRQGVP